MKLLITLLAHNMSLKQSTELKQHSKQACNIYSSSTFLHDKLREVLLLITHTQTHKFIQL